MAHPTINAGRVAAQSKTSGTTLAAPSVTVSTGDVLVVGFGMDPQTGTVSFAQTAGTATLGSWTIQTDQANGSGTSGVRGVTATASVTAGGTCTVTATHPTATARTIEVLSVAGCDSITPVQSANSGTTTPTLTPVAGTDLYMLTHTAAEIVSGTTNTVGLGGGQSGFTADFSDSVSQGTSGASSASNISSAIAGWFKDGVTSTSVSPSASLGASNNIFSTLLFQAPQAVITAELWENGSFVATLGTFTASATHTVFSEGWDAALLSDPLGEGVELRLTSPSPVTIGAIAWDDVVLVNAGSQNYTDTENDNRGLTDAASTATAFTLSFTDDTVKTDAMSDVEAFALTQNDPLGSVDSVTKDVAKVISPDDTLGSTDTNSHVTAFSETYTDNGTASADTTSSASIFLRTISPDDTTGLVDSPVKDFSKVLSPTDVTGLVDTPVKDVGKVISPDDVTGLVDTNSRVTGFAPSFTDPLGSTDTMSDVATFARTLDDPTGLVDTSSSLSVYVRQFNDPLGSTDTATPAATLLRTISPDDPTGLVDAQTAFRGVPTTLPPDAILVETGASGAVGLIQDDPASPDANWVLGSGALDLRVSFGSPGGTLAPGAAIQKFRILARMH